MPTPATKSNGEPVESFNKSYRHVHQVEPPNAVEWGESTADLISPSRGFMTGFDYTLQLQVGCPGGCLFCYVPSGARLIPAAVRGEGGRNWGFRVRRKQDPIGRLCKHLQHGRLADKTVYWSGVTDPYSSPPRITRVVWNTLRETEPEKRPRRIAVQTRYLASRDAEVMAVYAAETVASDGGPPVVISFSLGTDREDLIQAWERATPTFANRLKDIEQLRLAGLPVVATLSPFGLWEDLPGVLKTLDAMGVAYVTVLFFKQNTSSANTPRPFLEYLRKDYPQLLDPTWQSERVQEIKAVFGDERVLVGQAGFASLTAPHTVGQRP